MLTDLLKPELVACHVEASDWEEAIKACGKLLVDAGKCDQSYVDAMISSVHKFGPYMVLEEGIAMPHAQADGNVSERGSVSSRLTLPLRLDTRISIRFTCSWVFAHPTPRLILAAWRSFRRCSRTRTALPSSAHAIRPSRFWRPCVHSFRP